MLFKTRASPFQSSFSSASVYLHQAIDNEPVRANSSRTSHLCNLAPHPQQIHAQVLSALEHQKKAKVQQNGIR